MLNIDQSRDLFAKAQNFIPGGVNSPVRAFKAVGGDPIFIKSAKGAFVYDQDNNQYIELINSWGPMILGHAHEVIEEAVAGAISSGLSFGAPTAREVEIAELITEMVNFLTGFYSIPVTEKQRLMERGPEKQTID